MLEINETLTMINTMYQEKSGEFIKKNAELMLIATIENKGSKKLGHVKLDLAEFIAGVSQKIFPISDCPDKKASICLSVVCSPLGNPTIVDNISEASGNSGVSMGTEGEYSGPLFNDSGELEEEQKKKLSSSLKPPRMRKKRNEESENSDAIALVKILERENNQIKTEKDEIKTQLALIAEKSKTEREYYCAYVEKLEHDIDNNTLKINKIKEKYKKYKEMSITADKKIEEINSDFEEYKLRYNHAEKRKTRGEIKVLKAENFEIKENVNKLKQQSEEIYREKHEYELVIQELKSFNDKIAKELVDTREQIQVNIEKTLDTSLPPNSSFRKKAQDQMNALKNELKEAHEEIEELRAKQTESISQMQQLKTTNGLNEENLKEQVRKLEYELKDKNDEISELNSRIDEEMHSHQIIERKTIIDKADTEDKVSRLNKSLREMTEEKDIIQQRLIDFQRKQEKEKALANNEIITKFEGTIALNYKEIARLQSLLQDKETEVAELSTLNESLENENYTLQEHLKKASVSEFSDPATSILIEKVAFLEGKIQEIENSHSEEKKKLTESINILEKMIEISDSKHNSEIKEHEDKIELLQIENFNLKNTKENIPEKTVDFLTIMNEENYKQQIDLLNIQISDLNSSANKTSENLKNSEQKYQEIKLSLAKKELEKENIQTKYREAQDQLREYSAQYTMLEVELYKINEKFGQVLNTNNELENELQDIKEQIFLVTVKKKKN